MAQDHVSDPARHATAQSAAPILRRFHHTEAVRTHSRENIRYKTPSVTAEAGESTVERICLSTQK